MRPPKEPQFEGALMIAVATERLIVAPTLEASATPTAGILAQALGEVRRRDLAYAATKRAMDFLVAATLLLILLPVFLAVAIAIRLETEGPIVYRGERIGRFGNRFTMVKFRSMRANCDPAAHAAFVRTLLQDGTKCDLYKVPNDPRITRVGAVLRRTSLHVLARMIGAGMDVTLLGSTIGKSRYTASLVRAGSVRFLRCDDSFSEEDILRPALADAEALVLLGYVRPSALSPARRLGEELVLNLAPLVRLLRAAEGKTRHVIFASSLGVYGSHASAPVRETDAPRPETPYAIAKLASEESIEVVCAAGGWTPCVLRYATVYGPGETVPRAIPNFIQAALDGQPPVIAGDGLDEHDYIHVTDVVDATMLALRRRA